MYVYIIYIYMISVMITYRVENMRKLRIVVQTHAVGIIPTLNELGGKDTL